jgi:hypothetical protein
MAEVALVAGSMAFDAIGQAQEAKQKSRELKFQQQQYESAAQDELLASTQEEAQRRRELNDTLATIDAMRAARGLSASPGGAVFKASAIANAERDIGINTTNRLVRADANRQSAGFARAGAKTVKKTGMFGIGKSLFSGGRDIYGIYNKGK